MIKKAFSIAEMMVVMLILSIVLAAAMPIITKRVVASNSGDGSGSELWQVTSNSKDIYYGTDAEHRVSIGTSAVPLSDPFKNAILTLNTNNGLEQSQITFLGNGQYAGNLYMGYNTGIIDYTGTIEMGNNAGAGPGSIGIGYNTIGGGGFSTAIGNGATSWAAGIAIGCKANAKGTGATGTASDPINNTNYNIAIGYNAISANGYSTTIGYNSQATSGSSTALGNSSRATSSSSTALGNGSQATSGPGNTALGYFAQAAGQYSVAIGYFAKNTGNSSTAIGHDAQATGNSSTAIGKSAQATAANQIMLGTINERVDVPGTLFVKGVQVASDKRLKNIKGNFNYGLEKIRQIKPIKYTYKNDKKNTQRVGVIAQDLQKIFPDAVSKDKNDKKGYLSIRTDDMFYAMINSIQQLDKSVQMLIKNIKELNNKFFELNKNFLTKVALLEAKDKQLEAKNKQLLLRIAYIEKSIK